MDYSNKEYRDEKERARMNFIPTTTVISLMRRLHDSVVTEEEIEETKKTLKDILNDSIQIEQAIIANTKKPQKAFYAGLGVFLLGWNLGWVDYLFFDRIQFWCLLGPAALASLFFCVGLFRYISVWYSENVIEEYCMLRDSDTITRHIVAMSMDRNILSKILTE